MQLPKERINVICAENEALFWSANLYEFLFVVFCNGISMCRVFRSQSSGRQMLILSEGVTTSLNKSTNYHVAVCLRKQLHEDCLRAPAG